MKSVKDLSTIKLDDNKVEIEKEENISPVDRMNAYIKAIKENKKED